MARIRVATCQFPVSAEVGRNGARILAQMREARGRGADVVHFCEGALSGYAGVDFASFEGYRWAALRERTERVREEAARLGIAVVAGTAHPLTGRRKPHNSVWVFDARGRIVDRYDKRFCAGDSTGRTGELAHFTPGDHPTVFRVGGVRCGVLVCHEYRYPELVRELVSRGVRLIFHSFHAANVGPKRLAAMRRQVGAEHHAVNPGTTLPEITMPASMIAAAASSHVFVSAANSSARESCFPAFFVRADGVVTKEGEKGGQQLQWTATGDAHGGEVNGEWDAVTKQAFWVLVGNENLEERWSLDQSPDKIDRVALDYLRKRFG